VKAEHKFHSGNLISYYYRSVIKQDQTMTLQIDDWLFYLGGGACFTRAATQKKI